MIREKIIEYRRTTIFEGLETNKRLSKRVKRDFTDNKDYNVRFVLRSDKDNLVQFDTTIKGYKLKQGMGKAIKEKAIELGYDHYYAHLDIPELKQEKP